MTGLASDLRAAGRYFGRHRGLTVVAVTSLAFGIGVSVAITSVSDAVLARPLPYDNPSELVMVWRRYGGPDSLAGFRDPRRQSRQLLTPETVLHWRTQLLPFADFAVVQSWDTGPSARVDLLDGAGVERLRGALATANIFSVLGVGASVGRTFLDGETGVVVISHQFWQRRFGGDPAVVGKTVTLATGRDRGAEVVQIIGILPMRFQFTYPEETEIWLPLTWPAIAREFQIGLTYRAVARLRKDTSLQAAEAAMQAFLDDTDRYRQRVGIRIWLEPVQDYVVGPTRGPVVLLSALALLVLLGGAINGAIVFAASAVTRIPEIQLRRALGASQRRIASQILTEAAVIAVLAAVVGGATVLLSFPALRAMLPADLPRRDELSLDLTTLLWVFIAVAVSTLVAGVFPAWVSARHHQQRSFQGNYGATIARSGLRLRVALLGLQFALVTTLLVSGGMLLRSFWKVVHVDKGYEVDPTVLVADIQLIHPAYANKSFDQFEAELLRRVRELSYIDAAGATSAIPLRGTDFVGTLRPPDGGPIFANRRNVDTGYFDVMRIPLVSGRWFTAADTADSNPVALVSQSLAAALYPGADPVGKELWGSGAVIIGVVADVRARSLADRPMPAFYVPRAQRTSNMICLVVRTGINVRQFAFDLQQIVDDVYPGQPIQRVTTLEKVVADSVADRRAYAVLASAFAIVMLLLSCVGLCGHLSHVVAERRRDLAIRAALGASSGRQAKLLIMQVLPAVGAGFALAAVIVLMASPFLMPYLFDVDRVDQTSWIVSVLLVVGFTACALALPIRRILTIDAASTLRAVS